MYKTLYIKILFVLCLKRLMEVNMNNLWSTKVQSTELLYYSRLERFNDKNCARWFDLLKVKDGMKVLEVGCGGGHFTNMVKEYFPNCEVWGIDLDAKQDRKSTRLNSSH